MNGELRRAGGAERSGSTALRLIVKVALEGEVGSERYARGESEKAAYRNGYRTVYTKGRAG